RVLLSGLYGNYTISWNGWSQAAGQLLHGRLLAAYRQWRLYYQSTPYSPWGAFRKLLIEPLIPAPMGNWADRRRRPHRVTPWQDHAPIRVDFETAMAVGPRAREVGHDFLYRTRPDEHARGRAQIDDVGDWQPPEKAVSGNDVQDPTADIDVISYYFG